MKTWTPRSVAAILAAIAVAAAMQARAAPPKAAKAPRKGVFTIVNKTDWTIKEIHITEAEEDTWSANLIKGRPLAKGATAKLDVECYEQDVKLVDAKGKTCTSESMYPCDRDSTWTLTPEGLAGCKDFGR
jgi:hypothetical protein